MTTILAVQGDNWATVGFDSLVSDENGRTMVLGQGSSKIAKNGQYLLGAAGDVRAINILAHAFSPPRAGDLVGSRLDRFITSKFIPALRECFEDHGYVGREAKEKASHGSIVLVLVNGSVYEIDEDYSWVRDSTGIYAAGTGGDYALGAFYAMAGKTSPQSLGLETVKKMIKESVTIATTLDASSGGVIKVMQQVAP